MRTLILNAGYEPMQMVSWQRALCLVLAQKAEIVVESATVVRSVSASFTLPSVVRLKRYIRVVQTMSLVKCSRKNILLRDHNQCQYCSVKLRPSTASIDHIVPRARGGKTVWNNVVAACHPCNRKKGSKRLDKSGLVLRRPARRPSWRDLMTPSQKDNMGDWLAFLDQSG